MLTQNNYKHCQLNKIIQSESLSLPLSVCIIWSQCSSMFSAPLSSLESCSWDIDGWLLLCGCYSFLSFCEGLLALAQHQRLILGSILKFASGVLLLLKSMPSSDSVVRHERLSTLVVSSMENTHSSFPLDAGTETNITVGHRTKSDHNWHMTDHAV